MTGASHTQSNGHVPPGSAEPEQPSPLRYRTATALMVAVVFFMETLDATVITTALPTMAKDFAVPAASLSAGVSAYLVALTVFIPLSGWFADRFGPRRVFASAIAFFTLASLLCAASDSLLTFTLARVLQGIAGAMMVPVGRLLVMRDTPKDQIVKTVAILTWPALSGPIVGPALGGWITMQWSWEWIFLLNLPIGILAFVASLFLIRPVKYPVKHFDMRGFLLCSSGIGLFMIAVETASHGQAFILPALTAGVAGIALLMLCSRYLLRSEKPLFDLSILQVRTYASAVSGGSLSRIALNAAPFLLPLTFQLGFGYSPAEAGALFLWLFVGNLCMKPTTTWIMNRFGFRRVLMVNSFIVAGSFLAYAALTEDTPTTLIAVILFITGMTRSVQFTAFYTMAFADIEKHHMNDANTLFGVVQRLNSGMGIAVGALTLAIAQWFLGGDEGAPVAADFSLAFILVSVLALMTFIDVMRLPADAGHSVLKKRAAAA